MMRMGAPDRARIASLAETAYPDECCGLLVGCDRPGGGIAVTRIVEAANVCTDRARDRFEVDPRVRIALERELRGAEERIVGHYHSHPDHPAKPSATDLEMAFEPNLVWVIVSVVDGKAGEMNAFRLNAAEDAFEPVALVAADS